MTAPKPCPTQAELKRRFDYDPLTGVLTYRAGARIGLKAGQPAGSVKRDGYLSICIHKKNYQAHRLIWVYVTGSDPGDVVDHINGNRTDNRFENLRNTNQSVNLLNIHEPVKNSAAGLRGVTFCKQMQKFKAQIRFNRRAKHLGFFENPEDAHAAYVAAKAELMP